MTPEELAAIRKATDAAPNGTWSVKHLPFHWGDPPDYEIETTQEFFNDSGDDGWTVCHLSTLNAATFIAGARSWIPQLLDYIDELEAELQEDEPDWKALLAHPVFGPLIRRDRERWASQVGQTIHIPRISDLVVAPTPGE